MEAAKRISIQVNGNYLDPQLSSDQERAETNSYSTETPSLFKKHKDLHKMQKKIPWALQERTFQEFDLAQLRGSSELLHNRKYTQLL